MKFALDSAATALARSVLPQPGGPHSSTPVGAEIPNFANFAGSLMGSQMAISSSSRTPASAPTSRHVVSGTVAKPSRLDDGVMVGRTASKASIVITVSSNPSGLGASVSLTRVISRRIDWFMRLSTLRGMSLSISIVVSALAACFSSALRNWSMDHVPALLTRSFKSAPTNPAVLFASIPKSTSCDNFGSRVRA